MPERIIVSGIYRSGTSLATELIHRWGAYAGRQDDIFQDEYGYMEHLALQKLNDELLNDNSRVPTPVDQLVEKAHDPILKERALEILDAMDREAADTHAIAWVWKDPRLPLVLPFWSDIWGDVIYVIPVRHPVETILSAAKMEGLEPDEVPLSAGFVYWQFCMLNLLTFTVRSYRKLFIAYDQLIQNPQQECTRLCNFLDMQCKVPAEATGRPISKMAEHITAKQHHFKHPAPLSEVEVTTKEQRALFNFLRLKTIYPDEAFNRDDFSIYPGWMEYLQTIDLLVTLNNIQKS
ncbi:MAG TPA: sulfotransferase [Anaerolineales bacterium]|nr:sulfotransferase [Anaerolineales bacterium]HLO34415.1 sulfotransferase [Anaerolineales bacterium]